MMRHRPDLCVESGRRREARPPFSDAIGVSDPVSTRCNRTPVQDAAGSSLSADAASSATPHRMSCSDTSMASSPKCRSTCGEDHHAGDDRRRAVRVQAGDVAALGERHRRQPRRAARRAGRATARGPRPARGRRGRARGRSRRRTSRCRPRRRPRGRRARRGSGTAASSTPRTSAASASSSSGRGGSECEVALGVAHDADLGGDVELARGRATPTTSSVEPPPMSINSRGVVVVARPRSRRGRSAAPPRRRSGARVEPEALAHRGGELGAVGGVAHRGGHDRHAALARVALDRLGVRLERREHALLRRVAEPPARVDALAEPGDDRCGGRARSPCRRARRRRAGASSSCRCRRRRRARQRGRVGHRPAVERREQVLDCHGRHLGACTRGRRADVRNHEQVRRVQQRVVGAAAARGR